MKELKFVDYILDNIHGYIALTEMESQIEKLPIFRRLRGIKQLGLTNWIFPGAEHTRYSHSLGVMHIADEIAQKLDFKPNERQFLRVCAMLHDIGHYPLSHVGERAYKKKYDNTKKRGTNNFEDYALKSDYSIADFAEKLKIDDREQKSYITHAQIQKADNPYHHENIGERVIRNNDQIVKIIANNNFDVNDVCAVITGDISKISLTKYVQILHSELDADRIDYLLRDTNSSGTAYGAFEINTLIKNMEMVKHKHFEVDIIGVNTKGIMSADQFLINRYFAYSQVFHHKYVTILSYMSELVVSWLLSDEINIFPNEQTLFNWIDHQNKTDDYFNFTDSFFVDIIKKIDVKAFNYPEVINKMIYMLNHYLTPEISNPTELNNVVISGKSNEQMFGLIKNAELLNKKATTNNFLKIDETYLTENVSLNEFRNIYNERSREWKLDKPLEYFEMHRLIKGICVIQNEIVLLADSPSSLVKDLSRHRTLFFRTYDMG